MNQEIFLAKVPFRTAQGIPCFLGVTDYVCQPPFRGPAQLCDSDWDFFGFEEVEFKVLDWRERNSPWLLRTFTDEDNDRVHEAIHKFIERRNQDEQTT